MIKIERKPLSVNAAWQGRRFKTDQYKQFERDCLYLLPQIKIPNPPFEVHYHFAFSSKTSDLLNPEKITSDILCKKYGFDDRDIFKMVLTKEIVEKGKEYFSFEILSLSHRV